MLLTGAKERRIDKRLPIEFPARILISDSAREEYGQALDISAKGIGILTHEEITADSGVELWLDMPQRQEPFYAKGKVVWSERLEPYRYKSGVSLEK